jgi:hypothetical protein
VYHSIVGIQPKPPFYRLFESLKDMPDNKIIIFRPGVKQKETDSGITQEPDFKLVETGKTLSLPETRYIVNQLSILKFTSAF